NRQSFVGRHEGSTPFQRFLGAFDPLFVSRQGGLSSRFFRESVDPGAGFQLGWGDRDAFRFLGSDTASILTGRTTWTGGTGFRLPLNLRVTGNYSDTRTDILNVRSDREIRSRSWPDLRVSMSDVPVPQVAERLLESLAVSAGFRQTLMETTFGGRGLQRRVMEEVQIPLDVALTWAGEVSTQYRGSFTRGEGEDPTGDTRNERESHTFLLTSTLAEPPLLAERLDGPLRISMGYQYSSELNCRTPFGRDVCVPFVDFLNRSVSFTLDTVISPMEVGLHLTYTNRQSFVGRHEGSTQFQMGIFGEFLFNSGTFADPANPSGPGGF
ncbi:hypothetical protein ACFL0I_01385, partial [Gemmatimonadota bacterium]